MDFFGWKQDGLPTLLDIQRVVLIEALKAQSPRNLVVWGTMPEHG